MTTPNLANITTITPQTFVWNNAYIYGLTGLPAYSYLSIPNVKYGLLQNPNGSNTVYKINTIKVTSLPYQDDSVNYTAVFSQEGPLLLSNSQYTTTGFPSYPTLQGVYMPPYFASVELQRYRADTVPSSPGWVPIPIYANYIQNSVTALTKETPIYLMEGDVISAGVFITSNQQGAPSNISQYSVLISYEIIG